MCNMAAYAGPGRAAPELIALLQAQEGLAGGHFTGIATLHEGRIYLAKVCGDCRRLLENTDAMNLPGSVGIAHSRTPGIALDSWAQPFLASDGQSVYCCNGIGAAGVLPAAPGQYETAARKVLADGFTLATGVDAELPPYPRFDGKSYHSTEIKGALAAFHHRHGLAMREAMRQAFAELPRQTASLALAADEPDQVSVMRFNQSLFYGRKDGAMVIATSGTALQDRNYSWIQPVQAGSVATMTRDEIRFAPLGICEDRLMKLPDLAAAFAVLDEIFADGADHGAIDLCDELHKHTEVEPAARSPQNSFTVYSYLMEKLRRGELLRGNHRVPASRPDTLRDETVFRIPAR